MKYLSLLFKNKKMSIKNNLLVVLTLLLLFSCKDKNRPDTGTKITRDSHPGLFIHQKSLTGYSNDIYSKSYQYFWKKGNDTLDLHFTIFESKNDSTVSVTVHNRQPVYFQTVLDSLSHLVPEIKKNFDLSRLSSLYFKPLIYYPDLDRELSNAYEKKFGNKAVGYPQLNTFLLSASVTAKIDAFGASVNKKVSRYGIEKFHLLQKKDYHYYLSDYDTTDYPEFSLHGAGLYITLSDK